VCKDQGRHISVDNDDGTKACLINSYNIKNIPIGILKSYSNSYKLGFACTYRFNQDKQIYNYSYYNENYYSDFDRYARCFDIPFPNIVRIDQANLIVKKLKENLDSLRLLKSGIDRNFFSKTNSNDSYIRNCVMNYLNRLDASSFKETHSLSDFHLTKGELDLISSKRELTDEELEQYPYMWKTIAQDLSEIDEGSYSRDININRILILIKALKLKKEDLQNISEAVVNQTTIELYLNEMAPIWIKALLTDETATEDDFKEILSCLTMGDIPFTVEGDDEITVFPNKISIPSVSNKDLETVLPYLDNLDEIASL
jgi:hypothetical protein